MVRTNLNEEEHVDALQLQIRAEPAAREEVEVGEAPVSVHELTDWREILFCLNQSKHYNYEYVQRFDCLDLLVPCRAGQCFRSRSGRHAHARRLDGCKRVLVGDHALSFHCAGQVKRPFLHTCFTH